MDDMGSAKWTTINFDIRRKTGLSEDAPPFTYSSAMRIEGLDRTQFMAREAIFLSIVNQWGRDIPSSHRAC